MTNCSKCNIILTEDNKYKSEKYRCKKCCFKQMKYYWIEYRIRIKKDILSHYSKKEIPECANPFGEHSIPYTNIKALSVDHINGGGTKHIKSLGGGQHFYRWIIKNNYP